MNEVVLKDIQDALDFVNAEENNEHVVRATPLMVGDYLHLTNEQYEESKQYVELEETKHPYYNYVVTKIYSQRWYLQIFLGGLIWQEKKR